VVRPRLVCLALALVTLLVYLPVRRHGFILYDDPDYVTENRMVQAGLTSGGIKWAFTTWHANNWHPLTWLSHMLDCELFDADAGAHHLVSAGFHAANAALLLLILFRLTGALWPSAVVAALFAWHPLRVESVAWASERKDVLSALFFLLTLWAYTSYARRREPAAAAKPEIRNSKSGQRSVAASPSLVAGDHFVVGHRSCVMAYLLSLSFFACGLLSKPMLVTTPFVLLLLDFWPLGRFSRAVRQNERPGGPTNSRSSWGVLWLEKVPFLVLSAASCVITYLAQRSEAVVGLAPYAVSSRLANAVVSYAHYLLKTFWPWHLSVVYPLVRQLPPLSVVASALLLAGLSWLAWRMRRRRPHLIVGWLWFLGMLVPVIGLVQVGGQAMADRYTYLPQIGLFVALVFEAGIWAARSPQNWPVVGAVTGICLAACLVLTTMQLKFWQDSVTLFSHAVEVTKDNAIARVNLGVALEQEGQRQEALAQYQAAAGIDPNLAQAQNNLAALLDSLGRPTEALEHYQAALRLKPNAPLAQDNFGTLLVKLGKFDEGMSHYAKAAELDASDPRPHYLMAKALWRQGRSRAALIQFQEALRLDEKDVQALVYLARLLASDPDASVRDGTRALSLAQKANELTGGNEWLVLDTLGMAYAETGQFEQAQNTARKALDACQASNNKEACSALEEHLRLYESGRPCRGLFVF